MREPSIPILTQLFTVGFAKIPEDWSLTEPVRIGLLWKGEKHLHFATPLLLELTKDLRMLEKVALLLGTEGRYRELWLNVLAQKLSSYGQKEELLDDLCSMIDKLGATASVLIQQIQQGKRLTSPFAVTEQASLGNPVSHPATHPILVRILGRTASLVEGNHGRKLSPLLPVQSKKPKSSWRKGRLIQEPSFVTKTSKQSEFVLSGEFFPCPSKDEKQKVEWVSQHPWCYLLALLVFAVEAWNAEGQGGLKIEFSMHSSDTPHAPSSVGIIVTLADQSEVYCGTLGELLLHFFEILEIAIIPLIDAQVLDSHLGGVIRELLKANVWRYDHIHNSYLITDNFSSACYRSEGFRIFSIGSKDLSSLVREAAVSLALRKQSEITRAG